ncbi:DUF3558 domain-containing protein [Streptomyces sp. A7024]|uniref:DUF3558 domain-containing protein n=1 Tax=Streptomyces coryli TaxID=1128680 RepID=A0A6G4UB89_9ACTN|nr:DUF3558 family protein [Streptomyces coryli]NGN69272.1 DUF3558 domain-containing protein [Streptomyces coryli]
MFNDNRKLRRHSIVTAATALLLLAAGCGSGGDASPAAEDQPETSARPSPEIKDPAVEPAALRNVDPCGLLNARTLGKLGTVAPDSQSSPEWGVCSADVKDASGGTVELTLRVGDQLTVVDDPTEKLKGLPLVIDDDDAPKQCWTSVLTSYETSLAITFQVEYAGGDACAAGKKALAEVVDAIHAGPPQYRKPARSVLATDPCTAADKQAVATALGKKPWVEVNDLHTCDMWAGDTDYPQVSVRFFKGLPLEAADGQPVDLGGGVRAIQAKEKDITTNCDVSWRRVATPTPDQATGYGELVSVTYSDETESSLDTTTACKKAVAVARTVVPSLG